MQPENPNSNHDTENSANDRVPIPSPPAVLTGRWTSKRRARARMDLYDAARRGDYEASEQARSALKRWAKRHGRLTADSAGRLIYEHDRDEKHPGGWTVMPGLMLERDTGSGDVLAVRFDAPPPDSGGLDQHFPVTWESADGNVSVRLYRTDDAPRVTVEETSGYDTRVRIEVSKYELNALAKTGRATFRDDGVDVEVALDD